VAAPGVEDACITLGEGCCILRILEAAMKGTKLFISIALCCALFAGCSGRAERYAEAVPDAAPEKKSVAQAPAGKMNASPVPSAAAKDEVSSNAPSSTLGGLPNERMVIKSATLMVRVRDVASAYARAVQLAETNGGYVQNSTQYQEGGERAEVTIRVPPHGFLPLISSLETLGKPDSKSIGGEDVTEEYYDLSAELENQLQVQGRLFQLLKKTVKVADVIAVEEQLERVGANVNRIKGRMKYLETMTGMSTISLSLYSNDKPFSEGFINWSMIGHGFFRAAQILVNALFVVLQVLLVAIPLAVIGGAAAWGIVLLVRWTRGRRGAHKAPGNARQR